METNSVNTDLSEELLNSLAKEERTELLDFINNYPFINWMVSANRPYAKDVPKDKTGKIIVDVVKPHILENTNYFRKAAIAYKRYGRYTNLRPNGNPNSPYMKWLRKEVLKCWYGCKRPSDGEWITGYHYFYLNYSPIERSTSTVGDSKAVGRVVDFPDFYDLDYLFFHYVNQARYGGKYNNYEGGQHCGIIAARGKGKMIPNSTIVYTPSGYKIWKDIHPGDYLYGDNGKPTKVLEEFNHKDKPIYKLTLKDGRVAYAGLEHLWTIKYGDKLITVDTQWIIEHLHKDRIIIPLNKPVQIKERPISLDPFRYGLSIKTRVNDNYKFNSESIRRKVLEGILSRSKIIGFGTVKFTTKYSKLADDVLWLGRSLGYICREEKIRVINRTIYSVYVQNFYTNLDKYIEITNVEYSHNEDAKCVIVDNDSHLFLMNDFIVTHNSFKVSSMSARNFILGENMDVCEKVKSLVVASNTEYLKKDGTLNKTLAMADFLAKSTQFPSNRVKSSTQDMHWIMGYRDPKNKDVISGTKNEILGLSFNNDSDKGRGKRSQLIVWEEFGMFPNFLDAWNTSRPNTEEGGFAFGQSIAIGTGGSSGSDFSGALEMIYNPLGYNVYGIPNVYDKGASGGAKCIFFIGEYMNRKGCYDKDGNSDIVKAVLEEVKERVYIKYNSSDPSTIAQRIAEHPMSIQEAIMRRDGTLFPVADLTDHLNYIEANKIEWNRGHLVGELSQDPNGNISFKPTDDEPIRDFPLKDNRHRGALEIYELPKEVNGKVPSYRYIAGVDPIDDDHSTTVSLPSIIVLDMFTDRVVAEYTGRPDFADDFYEICRRLGIYYNALINYENDKKGLFTYFSNNHCTYLLAQTPEILRDTELVKSSLYGNKSFGTQSGKQVNAYARRLIRDWLLMPVKQTKIEIDENGNEVEKTVTIKNLQRLRGTAMIKELIMWNPDINADRVSALGMLMILRENNMKYLPGEGTSTGKKVRKNYLGNDPFFTNNFANTTFW